MFLEAQAEAIIDTPKILTKAIDRSQHCQRNFDLSKSIPEADMKKMVHAVTQCPSKQNVALYEAHFITNRDVIEEMHTTTQGFDYPDENGGVAYQTNSQVLANLVIVFTKLPINEKLFENEEVDYSVPMGYRSNAAVEWERGEISETEYKFKSVINKNHLNAISITHGGYLSALIDSGAGTAAHRAAGNVPCVTISLDIKFIGSSKEGDEIVGHTKILKVTPSNLGPGG